MVDWWADWLVWLVSWLVGWLAGWCTRLLAGFFVFCLFAYFLVSSFTCLCLFLYAGKRSRKKMKVNEKKEKQKTTLKVCEFLNWELVIH